MYILEHLNVSNISNKHCLFDSVCVHRFDFIEHLAVYLITWFDSKQKSEKTPDKRGSRKPFHREYAIFRLCRMNP